MNIFKDNVFIPKTVIIFVNAKPKSKKEYVKKLDETHFAVAVKEPPEKGNANKAIVKALADYFKTAPSNVKIISGLGSRQKIVEI